MVADGQSHQKPYVILVSFDGFRYDYASRFNLPNFRQFIDNGASAEGLIPAFPSKTFPNHYSIVTGLYPGHHGLVDNNFYDQKLRQRYAMKERTTVENPDFYGGTPLWQLAQQQGLRSASFFWVGSEAPVQGEYPTYYFPYDESVKNEKRIEQVIAWLTLPEDERPQFISLYFSLVDTEAHKTGTQSGRLERTLHQADSLLSKLMSGLKVLNFPVNVIIVSDHGMLELRQQEQSYITLRDLINVRDSSIIIVNGGTQVHVYHNNPDSLYRVFKTKEKNYRTYKRDDFPSHWHYNHYRTGDILLTANPGYYFQAVARNFGSADYPVFGVHGYDPAEVKEMMGIFYAIGPNIKSGTRLPAFENVHVYPLIAKILGLNPPKTDGDFNVLKPVLKK